MKPYPDNCLGRDAPTARPSGLQTDGRFVETSLPDNERNPTGRDAPTARPLPQRKTLPHGRPYFAESPFFITIHAEARDRNVLALPDLAPRLWEEWLGYARIGRCHPSLFLVMPDHVHGLFFFPVSEVMQKVVSAWKRITARRYGVQWQRDFFDHRIRNDEERMEKADYILMNPVRKGLVETPDTWPYVWRCDTSPGRDASTMRPPCDGRDAPTARPQNDGRFVETSLPERPIP